MKLLEKRVADEGWNNVFGDIGMREDDIRLAGYTRYGSSPLAVAIIVGVAVFATLALVVALLVARQRKRSVGEKHKLKQFLLPTNVKPVIGFKTAAGPGGLKKSPSPLQSPDTYMEDFHASHYHPVQPPTSTSPNVDMSPVEDKFARDVGDETTAIHGYEDEQCQGTLSFTMRYSNEKNALHVTIVSATNLPSLPSSTGSNDAPLLDPYVKLQLLPEKQHKVKTRVVRNTMNPVYEEEFTFYGINYNQLQSTTLHFAVVAFDRYSRDEIIGEIICPLQQVDLSDEDKVAELNMPLVSRSSKFENATNRGDLLLSLCYQPGTNKITAVVLKAKNLPQFDVTGQADPYVKVYMMYNGQKLAKKKTHVKKRTLTPVYNESFVFDLPSNDPAALDQISFEFLVMDWDRVTKNEIMGRCVIGMNTRGSTGRTHWEQVRRQPRRQIAEWHRLRP